MLMILGTAEWLLGKEKATLGQVAFFCANFHRHYIGQEADLALGISAAEKGTDEGVCKALIHFIKEELTTKDVRSPRNGFVHNDIAELGDLNWVVAKTIGLLEGLNQTIIWGQRG